MSRTSDDDKQGIESARVHTYEEIAAALGVTRSAARKIEQRALQKLRAALKEKGLSLSDYI